MLQANSLSAGNLPSQAVRHNLSSYAGLYYKDPTHLFATFGVIAYL